MQADGTIESRDLCSSSVIERTLSDEAVSSIKIKKTIQSDNFSTGVSGWQINRDTGSCEFQDAVIRGELNADDIVAGTIDASVITVSNINATNITTGTLNVARIGSNSIDMSKIELSAALETNQYIQSSTYTPGSAGWRINADGSAEFDNVTVRGTIEAGVGSDVDWSYISNVSIDNADITSLSFSKITAATNTASLTIGSSGYIQSSGYSAGTAGWRISAGGVAEFNNAEIKVTDGAGSSVLIDSALFEGGGSDPAIIFDGNSTRDASLVYTGGNTLTIKTGTSGGYITLYASTEPTNGGDVRLATGSGGQILANGTVKITTANLEFGNLGGHQYIDKTGGFNLYIRHTSGTAGAGIALQTYYGSQRTRIYIDADGNTSLYDRDGTEVLRIRTDNYLSVNTRIYMAHAANDYLAFDDANHRLHWVSDGVTTHTFEGNTVLTAQFGVGDSTPDASFDAGGGFTPAWQSYCNTSSTGSVLAEWRSNWSVANQVQTYIRGDGDLENRSGRYGTISDARLKVESSMVPARDYSDDLRHPDLAPHKYAFKASPERVMLGYIAQKVQNVKPGWVAATRLKTYQMTEEGAYATEADGKTRIVLSEDEHLSVATSLFIPALHSGWLAHDARLARIEQELGIGEAA